VATDHHNLRIPGDEWTATLDRARQVHNVAGSVVLRALMDLYRGGSLDGAVSAALASGAGVLHSGQEPEESSL